VLRDQLS